MKPNPIPSLVLAAPSGLEVVRRKGNTSSRVFVTVNADTDVTIDTDPDLARDAARYRKLRDRVDVVEDTLTNGATAWIVVARRGDGGEDPTLDAFVDGLEA